MDWWRAFIIGGQCVSIENIQWWENVKLPATQINDFRSVFSLARLCPNTLHGRVSVNMCLQMKHLLFLDCTCRYLFLKLWVKLVFLFLCYFELALMFVCVCLSQEEELERLEREFAIQSQITEAARRLASDPHVNSKKLKKQRKTSYLNALKKLQEIENSINEYRVRSGKKPTQRASLIIEGTSILQHYYRKINLSIGYIL